MLRLTQIRRIARLTTLIVFGAFLSHAWADDAPPASQGASESGYLKNTDLKAGLTNWHGSGELAFLKTDGTEGAEGDLNVTRVIKIGLSHGQSREVYQEYETQDKPTDLDIKVDVYASSDFKRSAFPKDYTSSIHWQADCEIYWWHTVVPNGDFWIRSGPPDTGAFFYILRNLKAGAWTTVDYQWQLTNEIKSRVINFCVPPGIGTVYLKNPSLKP